jgi:hypothetical protein
MGWIRTVIAVASGLLVLWRIVVSAVDWLSRFDFFLHQIANHEWVADMVEAVVAHPPPFDLTVTLALIVLMVVVLWRRHRTVATHPHIEPMIGKPRKSLEATPPSTGASTPTEPPYVWRAPREAIERFGDSVLLKDRAEKEKLAQDSQRKLDEVHERLNNYTPPKGPRSSMTVAEPDEVTDLRRERADILRQLNEAHTLAEAARRTLLKYVQKQLQRGALVARGFVAPHTSGKEPVMIQAAEWQLLDLDLEQSVPKAKGAGIEYIGIEIADPNARAAAR